MAYKNNSSSDCLDCSRCSMAVVMDMPASFRRRERRFATGSWVYPDNVVLSLFPQSVENERDVRRMADDVEEVSKKCTNKALFLSVYFRGWRNRPASNQSMRLENWQPLLDKLEDLPCLHSIDVSSSPPQSLHGVFGEHIFPALGRNPNLTRCRFWDVDFSDAPRGMVSFLGDVSSQVKHIVLERCSGNGMPLATALANRNGLESFTLGECKGECAVPVIQWLPEHLKQVTWAVVPYYVRVAHSYGRERRPEPALYTAWKNFLTASSTNIRSFELECHTFVDPNHPAVRSFMTEGLCQCNSISDIAFTGCWIGQNPVENPVEKQKKAISNVAHWILS